MFSVKFKLFILNLIIYLNAFVNSLTNDLNNPTYVLVQIKYERYDVTPRERAVRLATEHGFYVYKQVTGFPNVFIFKRDVEVTLPTMMKRAHMMDTQKDSIGDHIDSIHHDTMAKQRLNDDYRVNWAEHQKPLRREIRDLIIDDYEMEYSDANDDDGNYYNYNYNDEIDVMITDTILEFDKKLVYTAEELIILFKQNSDNLTERQIVDGITFNDELWEKQWYLSDRSNRIIEFKKSIAAAPTFAIRPKLDLNVLPVYARGITGRGVRIAVVDDGIEFTHDDLFRNYDPEISYDCAFDQPNPSPLNAKYNHGTRCAGEIAMVANNYKCGIGIAFNAKIGGIRILAGFVYDLTEGMALGFAHDKVDIYSISWGPSDDGMTLGKPGSLALHAIERGVAEGRTGRGAIYVWANGNGGRKGDNCNCDGYSSSIYTISVGSVNQHGLTTWYSEMCSSTLAVTYSSGDPIDLMIATTDLNNTCTIHHSGTSASAPLASGIIALGLEANPNLTWRDVQHIIVRSTQYVPLKHNIGWIQNGIGYKYNERLGFGLMDADLFVRNAIEWKMVPEKYIAVTKSRQDSIYPIKMAGHRKTIDITFNYQGGDGGGDGCGDGFGDGDGDGGGGGGGDAGGDGGGGGGGVGDGCGNHGYSDPTIHYVEHVEVVVHIDYTIRGALSMYLTSPLSNFGTQVQLLSKRPLDRSRHGFQNWKFMSVASWSENPLGVWKLRIQDDGKFSFNNYGYIYNCSLILHGTVQSPQ